MRFFKLASLTSAVGILQVVAIGRYEGKGSIGLPRSENVKAQHLLTFLPAFISFVLRLQELLTGALHRHASDMLSALSHFHILLCAVPYPFSFCLLFLS